ncbi:MAG: carboxypeptidase regulatory-like domain-containing protein, partial [Bryobacteraceae bacterium]
MLRQLFICSCSLIFTVSLEGQVNRATLTGVITDPSGSAVPAAKISCIQTATNLVFSTTTTSTGNYTLPALDIGSYRVEAEAAGFKRTVQDGIVLASGATVRLDLTLEIGAVSDAVEVTSRASALDTESTRVATTLTTKLVEDLPLVVSGQIRNVFNLALIAPETKSGAGSNGQFRIGGGQTASWDMNMDGLSVTSASTNYQYERAPISSAPVDAIQEFSVESTGMKAEFGRSMGTINFTTKSGTNQLHGNAFEFLRNNATDARGFFAQSTPVLKQHDFGGTFGGPVFIPKIYDGRNKTFFFISYEGFRNRAGNNPSYTTIPLPAMYNGDFSGWTNSRGAMIPIYDPASTRLGADGVTYVRDAFAGNQIPVSRFSQVAKNYIALRPPSMVPNVAGAGPTLNFFTSQGGNITPWNKGTIRGDHQIGSNNHLSFLFLKGEKDDDLANGQPPGLPLSFNGNSIWTRQNTSYRLSWDRTISSRIVNSLRGSFQREHGFIANVNSVDASQQWNAKLGIKNTPGPDHALPAMAMTQYTTWSG